MFDTSYEEYPKIEEVTKISDRALLQIYNSRLALIEAGGPYAESLEEGDYLDDTLTCWRVFDVNGLDNEVTRVVLFDELDDGSYSMHFKDGSIKPDFMYYEN